MLALQYWQLYRFKHPHIQAPKAAFGKRRQDAAGKGQLVPGHTHMAKI